MTTLADIIERERIAEDDRAAQEAQRKELAMQANFENERPILVARIELILGLSIDPETVERFDYSSYQCEAVAHIGRYTFSCHGGSYGEFQSDQAYIFGWIDCPNGHRKHDGTKDSTSYLKKPGDLLELVRATDEFTATCPKCPGLGHLRIARDALVKEIEDSLTGNDDEHAALMTLIDCADVGALNAALEALLESRES